MNSFYINYKIITYLERRIRELEEEAKESIPIHGMPSYPLHLFYSRINVLKREIRILEDENRSQPSFDDMNKEQLKKALKLNEDYLNSLRDGTHGRVTLRTKRDVEHEIRNAEYICRCIRRKMKE